jgi:D-xylonolactonase
MRPEPLANYHCHTGENPLWDDRRRCVFWTDIPAGRLFRWDYDTGEHRQVYDGEVVGGFTLQEDGRLLLFGAGRIWIWDPDGGGERTVAEDVDPENIPRFNDVIADPTGGVLAGTMGRTSESGGLFRLHVDWRIECLFRGTGCSNGLAFSPDRRLLYWTDSTHKRIDVFDYDPSSGVPSRRCTYLQLGEEDRTPDGMTVDADGNLWSARWGGWALHRYSPAAEHLAKIDFPVEKVSSVVFGGPDLDEMFVTTAGGSDDATGPEGTLYRLRPGVKGLPEFRSRVLSSDR